MRTLTAFSTVLAFIAASVFGDEKPGTAPARKLDFRLTETTGDCGWVLAITKDSILICDTGKKVPVAYPFHDRLSAGRVHKEVAEANSFRVCDVEVGDLVTIRFIKENKQAYCVELGICERPGGLIPPSQVINAKRPWYQWQNAQIAFRDKGTPIPEHLKSEGYKLVEQQEKERLKK